MYKVVCVGAIHREGMNLLQSRSDLVTWDVLNDISPSAIAAGVVGAHGIIVRTSHLTREILAGAAHLKIVSRHGVGTDNIDVAYLSSKKIPVVIAVDSNLISVAEHAMMLLLALAKDAIQCDRHTREGSFHYRDQRTASDVYGKTALIMGFGRVGQRVALLMQAFGIKVLAYDPFVTQSPIAGVCMVEDFRASLPETSFLCLHLPFTPETVRLVGAKELSMLRKGALLINCARGGIVDEDVLCHALENGALGGVGLDVFAKEPPDNSHRLFALPNVIVSPHNAALSEECSIRMAMQAVQNVLDHFDGKLQERVIINSKEIAL